MIPEPLSKAIYDKAKSLGVKKISLHFSGGNDEGYLNVYLNGVKFAEKEEAFASEVEEWAWTAYDYSGAGEGNDYGDDITYDLVAGTVESSEWSMQRQDSGVQENELEIGD